MYAALQDPSAYINMANEWSACNVWHLRLLRRLGLMYQGLDPIGDSLCGLAKLGDGPVGGVSLGDVVGPGVVDQPLGKRGGQHQLALSDGDEAVAQAVEPKLRPAGLADRGVEMMRVLDMAGRAGG